MMGVSIWKMFQGIWNEKVVAEATPSFLRWKELWRKLDLEDIVGFEASKRFQLQDMRMPLDNASIQRLLSPPVEVERGEWVEFLL